MIYEEPPVTAPSVTKPLLEVLAGRRRPIPPVWLMRQAGRYLPEYRALREQAGSFLDLCYTPSMAAEVTLQPIRRFGFDAAILFSDILVVPHALGQEVSFEAGEGPRLTPTVTPEMLKKFRNGIDTARLAPVYQTIRLVKAALPSQTTLLGFCGAPWTVASYMIAGRGGDEQVAARRLAYEDLAIFSELSDILVEASVDYLAGQFAAGVDAVQIFDTWAGSLTPQSFGRWCVEPVRRIVDGLRKRVPGAKVIGFPRAAGTLLRPYVEAVPLNAVGLDWMIDPQFVRAAVPGELAVQGNLDPVVLLAGGPALDHAVDRVLASFSDRPFIFNLGHGILPETPIAHVEQMLRRVRNP